MNSRSLPHQRLKIVARRNGQQVNESNPPALELAEKPATRIFALAR